MVTKDQYNEALITLFEYHRQLNEEIKNLSSLIKVKVDVQERFIWHSKLKAGDMVKIITIKRYRPSLSIGDIIQVKDIEYIPHPNGTDGATIYLSGKNTRTGKPIKKLKISFRNWNDDYGWTEYASIEIDKE